MRGMMNFGTPQVFAEPHIGSTSIQAGSQRAFEIISIRAAEAMHHFMIFPTAIYQAGCHGYFSVLIEFGLEYDYGSFLHIHIFQFQIERFGDPQTASIYHAEHKGVYQVAVA
jgi:hypothetical protein